MSSFLRLDIFAEKYQINLQTLYVNKSIGTYPSYVFHKVGKERVYIDEEYFLRRKKFKRKVWLESHDNFYFLNKHMNIYYIAKLLHLVDNSIARNTWSTFLRETLFSLQNESIFSYKTQGLPIKFYRYSRWLIRGAFLITNVKVEHRDIDVLLDYTKGD